MTYNILKSMKDSKTGKQVYVLLTDGLSEIWDLPSEEEANRLINIMNENSDSGWVYTVRKNCKK
jgi:hypothetical protein|tara:strand:+ start:475 stop:666 length:192 start_codon:yes stop_codon:yes gene_type:complete